MGGRTVISTPKMPSPAPNNRNNLIFKGHQKKEPPNCTAPKIAETTPTVAPTRVLLSQERGGWGGGGTYRNAVILHD